MIDVSVVRGGLPMGGRSVDDPTIKGFIDSWAWQVERTAGASALDASPAREAVRLGATADAREMVDAQSGFAESPVAKTQREAARALLKRLDELAPVDEEDPTTAEGEVDPSLYRGPTPSPLWPTNAPRYPDAGTWERGGYFDEGGTP